MADGAVAAEDAVEHRPRDADAAQPRAVAAATAAEGAADDVHRPAVVLRQRADGRAAEVGAGAVAAVAEERRVHDLELAAAGEDRAAAPALEVSPVELPSAKVRCWTTSCGRGLVVAVVGGPDLPLVAGVLVEDPALAAAAQRDQPAAVDHDPRVLRVDDLRGRGAS